MTVRTAEHSDLPAILAIYNESGVGTTASADLEPITLEQRTAWFDEHIAGGYPVLVAEDDNGRVVGWASLSAYHRKPGYRLTAEDSVYVAPDRLGKGIGALLLPRLIEAGRAAGFHTIVAVIGGTNEASVRLHERNGFKHAGTIRDAVRKFDRWQDIVYMQLVLNDEV
ncbi:MAG TPA: GNAT family N-acetyltransferase [Armatimonadota bacterium]|jgi:phosphinothricin acetyltransferase